MLTTTPFFNPLESCWPRPITSWRPSDITSATTATTLEVPISRPTIRFFASFVIGLSYSLACCVLADWFRFFPPVLDTLLFPCRRFRFGPLGRNLQPRRTQRQAV